MTMENSNSRLGNYAYEKAPIGKRIAAYLLDCLIGFGPVIILGLIGAQSIMHLIARGSDLTLSNVEALGFVTVLLLFGGGWAIIYLLFRDGFGRGQSWGKKAFGLMVVSLDDNQPCTRGKSFVRNIFAWIISVVLNWIPVLNILSGIAEPIIALIHPSGQRIGDMVGRTQVIAVEDHFDAQIQP